MRKLFLIFLALPLFGYSQLKYESSRKIENSNIEKYYLDASVLSEQIFSRIPDRYKKDSLNKKMSYQFACETANGISNFVFSNNVYMDWPELEGYVNDIIKKVIPDGLKNDTLVYAYMVKDGSLNAFSTGAGKIFLNIGLFADVEDEATFAYIILHELAHYYLRHQQRHDLADKTGKFDRGLLDYDRKDIFHYTIKEEYSTDSLAIKWMSKSGYNINGAMNAYKMEERIDMARLYRGEAAYINDIKTRKLIRGKNMDLLKKMEQSGNVQGQNYLVSEEKFKKFKEEAKPEILNCLLNGFDYYDCTEKAFKFHLFDPRNNIYISYLLESIRRNCYANEDMWDKLFITDRYTDTIGNSGFSTQRTWTYNLFKYLDPIVLGLSGKETENIIAKFYWGGDPKFSTYTEAFEYFYKLSNSMYDRECQLSAALSYPNEPGNRNMFIEKYLRYNESKKKDYAIKLFKDSVLVTLGNQKLLVIDGVRTSVRLGQDEIPVFSNPSDTSNNISFVVKSVLKNINGYKSIYLPDLLKTDFDNYSLLKELELLSFQNPFFVKNKTQLHYLDPKYYNLFYENKINEIIFVNCLYFEDRKSEKYLNAYKRATHESIKSIYEKDYGTRFLDIIITNVRMQEGKEIHVFSYLDRQELKDKNSGISEISKAIEAALIKFAEESKKRDDFNSGIK